MTCAPPVTTRTEDRSDGVGLVRALVASRRKILLFTLGVTVGSVALAFLLPPQYTASVVLLPTEDSATAQLGALGTFASTLGLALPIGPTSASDLYPSILLSDRLLTELVETRFPHGEGESRQLLEILDPGGGTEHERRLEAVAELREDRVRAHRDLDTGNVHLTMTLDDPLLSATAANTLTMYLEKFLIEIRQAEGSRNRTFIDDRLAAVRAELAAAEVALKDFRIANKRLSQSPELLLEEDRLKREVLLREHIFAELHTQREVARIEEVKNTPVLRVLDRAVPPVKPSRPDRLLLVVAGTILGLLVSTLSVLGRETLRRTPDLSEALGPLGDDFRGLGRVAGRRAS